MRQQGEDFGNFVVDLAVQNRFLQSHIVGQFVGNRLHGVRVDGVDGNVAALGDRHHLGVRNVAVKLDAVAGVLFEPVQIGAAAHDVQFDVFAVVQQLANAFAHGFHVIAVTERAQVEETGFAVAKVFCRRGIEFRKIRTDIDDFAGNVRIGFFGAVEVGLRYGDQRVGVAVGAVGAGGEGEQVVRDFF